MKINKTKNFVVVVINIKTVNMVTISNYFQNLPTSAISYFRSTYENIYI